MTDHADQLLAARARALAAPEEIDRAAAAQPLLSFTSHGTSYAVDARRVREVLPDAQVSHLPWAPPSIVGVTHVRGEIVTVADAARVLGLGAARASGPVLVLDLDGRVLGLRVESVDDVTWVRSESLRPPAGDAAHLAAGLVLGFTSSAVVLDVHGLLPDPTRPPLPQEPT